MTVTVTESPSATVYMAGSYETVTCGSSLSVMLTVAGVPAISRLLGSIAEAEPHALASSSITSSVAVTVNVLDISPELKVRLAGTPE